MLNEEAAYAYCIVFSLISLWIERTILHITDEHASHYIPSQKDALPFRSTRVHAGFCEAHFAQSLSFFM